MLAELVEQEIRARMAEYRHPSMACMDALQVAASYYGWISDDCLRDLAALMDMTVEELEATATFYNHVYRKPIGRHVITVCDSVSCWIMGYESVRDHLMSRLCIGWGETTADGRFTLLPIQCLGACDRAPAMMIDEELYCHLDAEKIDAILAAHS
jgi:NADH-quinone oxidoreductase subunit E